MKFGTTLLALLASVGIVTALPGNGGETTKKTTSTSCWASSTCKAAYYTKSKVEEKPVTYTETKTVYKPTKIETEYPVVYTSTKTRKHPISSAQSNSFAYDFPQLPLGSRRRQHITKQRRSRFRTQHPRSFARPTRSRVTATRPV